MEWKPSWRPHNPELFEMLSMCRSWHSSQQKTAVLGIIHTLIGVAIYWKVHIQPALEYDSTYGEIRCMYKDVKKTKVLRRYMEDLALHNSTPTVNW